MDPISIKITFEDLPISLQSSIIIFFNILCTLLVSITIILYLYIFKYIYKNYYKNSSVRLP
jgi:hypothetical protein